MDDENQQTTSNEDSDDEKTMLDQQTSAQILNGHEIDDEFLRPLKFAGIIVHKSCWLCFGLLTFLILVTIIVYIFFESTDFEARAYLVESDKYTESIDSFTLASDEVAKENSDIFAYPQTDVAHYLTYHFMFKLNSYKHDLDVNNPSETDYWILTPDRIETIIKYEDKIVKDKEWQRRFCYVGETPLDTNYSCICNFFDCGLSSPARYIADMYDYDYDNMTTDAIKEIVLKKVADPDSYWAQYFNPYVNETGQCYLYRSFLAGGLPIGNEDHNNWEYDANSSVLVHESDYSSANEDVNDQLDEYIDWGTSYFKDIVVDEDGQLNDNGMGILAYSSAIWGEYGWILMQDAMYYMVFSIIFVVLYMTIHLQSFFLSFGAVFQILMSISVAYFVYRLIYQIVYFDFLSMLIIFVLLGVGADDVFVFTDAWTQSVNFVRNAGSLEERMTFAFRRASKAMLVTQATTFFAFLATAISSLMPISAFGIWAATVIAMNYVLVITLYPTILIIHHKYIKKYEHACLCFFCNKCCNKADNDEVDLAISPRLGTPRISRQMTVEQTAQEYRAVEKFLGTKVARFIIRSRRYWIALFVVLFCLGCWGTSTIEAQSEEESQYDDDHYMQISYDQSKKFSASESDSLVDVHITWGIKGVNRDGTDMWDIDDLGKVVWDKHFDMSSVDAQEWLKYVCTDLKSSSLAYSADNVDCAITDFEIYLNATNQSFPITKTDKFNQIFYEFLQSDYGANTVSSSLAFAVYDEDDDEYTVKYIAIYTFASFRWDADSDVAEDALDDWNAYIREISDEDEGCPDGVCDSVQHISYKWALLVMQQAFVDSALQGIAIALPIAFVVMLISTRNIIISLFAVFDIIGIIMCELGIMALNGWYLGITESVSVVIIIGFSVDYVVHLANAYLESVAYDRHERLSFSLLTIGVSVVSGAFTTFGCGFFLILPGIVFFTKMGIIMMTTIVISLFWAMFFFTSILAEWGPQGDFGSIDPYIAWVVAKVKKCCGNNDGNNGGHVAGDSDIDDEDL